MQITSVERLLVEVPFHEIPERNMARQISGWHVSEVCKVNTDTGLTGYGETLPNYTWGRVTDAAVARVQGKAPAECMWDDRLGAGLQMALFDLVGQAAGVPTYRLLGDKVRDWCPLSWWSIDMPPEDMAAEAQQAVAAGYTAHKQKARPWFDVVEQTRRTSAVVPPSFSLDLDFNGHLVTAASAVSVLKDLDTFANVKIYESPIPQGDVQGNQRIRAQTRCAIAMHYGVPPIMTALREQVCDGFVVGGGASAVRRQAAIAQEANLPFWLQLVGTGITTAFALHLGAVCSHAQWPAVTCLNVYRHQLLKEPLSVQGGYVRVPEAPGLGVQVDEEALTTLATTSSVRPAPPAIYALRRWNDDVTYFAGELLDAVGVPRGYWGDSAMGNLPPYEQGTRLDSLPDDGTPEWRDLYNRVQLAPVRSHGR
ncbi:MAG: mandelate racemase/muconate lactonizing enzyme family protein [Chloroflexi bacterium]|nr:mandelate racemase/muconate lactonizing enzyme family protein [Chloroflexota bacterium]